MFKFIKQSFRKVVVSSLLFSLLLSPVAANGQTLYEYLTRVNGKYPTLSQRAELAAEYAIFGYQGTASQNTLLVERLQELNKPVEEGMFGAVPVTGYKTTLSSSISSTATVIPVSSLLTKDGHTLTKADIGNEIYLSLEAGASREEIVKCTNISGSTFTGCSRGLAFYGTSLSEVTANKKAHNAGSPVIMSNVHYWYSDVTNTTSTIAIGDNTTANNKCVWAYDSRTPRRMLCYNETSQKWTATDDGVSTYNLVDGGSGVTASSTKGIFITDGAVGINASSTSGLSFHTDGYLQITPSSTSPIFADVDGLDVKLNQGSIKKNSNNELTVVTSTTGLANTIPLGNSSGLLDSSWIPTSVQPKFGGTGADGALSITAGTTTTIDLGGSAYVIKNYTSITIPATAALTFSNPNANGTVVVLKATGDSTIGGLIYGVGFGAAVGSDSNYPLDALVHNGVGVGTSGTAGAQYTLTRLLFAQKYKTSIVVPGSSGVNGQNGSLGGIGGVGGRGGMGLRMEVKGTYTFTGTINLSGAAGIIGTIGAGSDCGRLAGSGGSGSGGLYHILVGTLSTNSGTYTVAGGPAVTGPNASSGSCFGTQGFGGASAGSYAGAGAKGTNGGTNDGGSGALGASGGGVVEVNTEF